MKRHILAENMRRFGTKNLTEGEIIIPEITPDHALYKASAIVLKNGTPLNVETSSGGDDYINLKVTPTTFAPGDMLGVEINARNLYTDAPAAFVNTYGKEAGATAPLEQSGQISASNNKYLIEFNINVIDDTKLVEEIIRIPNVKNLYGKPTGANESTDGDITISIDLTDSVVGRGPSYGVGGKGDK